MLGAGGDPPSTRFNPGIWTADSISSDSDVVLDHLEQPAPHLPIAGTQA